MKVLLTVSKKRLRNKAEAMAVHFKEITTLSKPLSLVKIFITRFHYSQVPLL